MPLPKEYIEEVIYKNGFYFKCFLLTKSATGQMWNFIHSFAKQHFWAENIFIN